MEDDGPGQIPAAIDMQDDPALFLQLLEDCVYICKK